MSARKGKRQNNNNDLARQLEETHIALMDWADWTIINEHQSAIGYPTSTHGDQASYPVYGPICPEVMMPPNIAKTNRAVDFVPPILHRLLILKYIEPGPEADKIAQYKKEHNCAQAEYYRRLDMAKAWVCAVSMQLGKPRDGGGNQ